MDIKYKIASNLERNDDGNHLIQHRQEDEDIRSLKEQNMRLEGVIERYDRILHEYQLKYGNELFSEIEGMFNNEDELIPKNIQYLIENFSIIKEYEADILSKNKEIEDYVNELNRLQEDLERFVQENKELRDELESLKE